MGNIVSLFDESGNALTDWAYNGHECHAYDILNNDDIVKIGEGYIHFHKADLFDNRTVADIIIDINPKFLMGFPPCTDLAVSGAAHFEKKRLNNINFQNDAVHLARTVEFIGNECGCIWFAENPVSVLATMWRRPDYSFHPYEYGGYLSEDDIHPRWPDYINPRDAYPKKTCLWTSNDFIMPEKKVVDILPGYSKQHNKLGGKSLKTKQIRSETPRGFARAIYEHYSNLT